MWLRRSIAALIGVALIAAVIWLAFQTTRGPLYVAYFGLASALCAPTGIALIGYALTGGSQQVLQRLSKVPEIEKLISEAHTQEERIRLLEEERSRLLEAVRLETRRQTLIARKTSLEQEGTRVLDELRAVDMELDALEFDIQASTVRDEIEALNERLLARQRGDVVVRVGDTYVRLSRELVRGLPFSPVFILLLIFSEALLRLARVLAEATFSLTRTMTNATHSSTRVLVARVTSALRSVTRWFNRR
jgi:vacuolar-type H+-ATPase subunit I/STV1